MKLQQQFPGFAFFYAGSVTLVLSEPLFKASPGTGGAVEVVFSVDAVRSAHEALRGRGVRFTQEPRAVTGDLWAANFDDPDGHHISIFGREQYNRDPATARVPHPFPYFGKGCGFTG